MKKNKKIDEIKNKKQRSTSALLKEPKKKSVNFNQNEKENSNNNSNTNTNYKKGLHHRKRSSSYF